MASSSLQKLIRNQTRPTSAFFTHFAKHPSPPPPFALSQISIPNDPSTNQPAADHFNLKNPIFGHVYPAFSFEFLLNHPVPSPTLIPPESDDAIVIRADSVKKKRKKKMNKHKLKKLRKRLRRKTK